MADTLPLVKGTLDLLVLKALSWTPMEGAMAKLFSSQVAERVTSISLELFGGYGYTKDYPAEKFYRDAKIGAIYEGTSNMNGGERVLI